MEHFCPICGSLLGKVDLKSPTYPFCSEHCRLIDLGNWLSDDYRISEKYCDPEGIERVVPEEEK